MRGEYTDKSCIGATLVLQARCSVERDARPAAYSVYDAEKRAARTTGDFIPILSRHAPAYQLGVSVPEVVGDSIRGLHIATVLLDLPGDANLADVAADAAGLVDDPGHREPRQTAAGAGGRPWQQGRPWRTTSVDPQSRTSSPHAPPRGHPGSLASAGRLGAALQEGAHVGLHPVPVRVMDAAPHGMGPGLPGQRPPPGQPVCARAWFSMVRLGAGHSGSLRYQSRSYTSRPLT